jgi:hypothetical protein
MAGFLNIRNDVTLVMTSSIDLNGMLSSSRPDPLLREQDYLRTLTYYVTRPPDVRRIVFIENSVRQREPEVRRNIALQYRQGASIRRPHPPPISNRGALPGIGRSPKQAVR